MVTVAVVLPTLVARFDDCMVTAPDYDFAVTARAWCRQADGPTLVEPLFDGFAQVRPLPPHARERLPAMVLLRQLTMLSWLGNRRDNPDLLACLPRSITDTIVCIEAFGRGELPRLKSPE